VDDNHHGNDGDGGSDYSEQRQQVVRIRVFLLSPHLDLHSQNDIDCARKQPHRQPKRLITAKIKYLTGLEWVSSYCPCFWLVYIFTR
jgi:hypothetical protein